MKDFREQNFYELLEIPVHATREEIDQAYRRAVEIFSVDSVAVYALFTPEELAALRRRIDEAYETVSSVERRRSYDLALGLRRPDSTPPPLAPPAPSPPPSAAEKAAVAAQPPWDAPPPPALEPAPKEKAPLLQASSDTAPGPAPESSPPRPAQLLIDPDTVFDGALLRKLREARGLSLEKLSEITKINIFYLRKLEEEDLAQLPEAVYVRGYLRLLAGVFKISAQQLLNSYTKKLDKKG